MKKSNYQTSSIDPTLCLHGLELLHREYNDNHCSDLLGFSSKLQSHYETVTSSDKRKQRGQFFTPPDIARFMAKLLTLSPGEIKVLDPGAGTGTLSAALCEQILQIQTPCDVTFELFETDPDVIPLLDENIKNCQSALKQAGHNMSSTIHHTDFILSNPNGFEQKTLFNIGTHLDKFDVVIMNPPYFKIPKSSQYANMMSRIIHGQPNIYALFMALSAEMLRPGGELVAITPRSFCNGLYFREFRRWYLKRMSLKHIHLFESRTAAFQSAKVLQESVITHAERSSKPSKEITISTSLGGGLQKEPVKRRISAHKVINNDYGDMIIRIPENSHDDKIMEIVESWPNSFEEIGLCISTGPVVMFRAKEFLLKEINGQTTVPLLSGHNIKPFNTIWPVHKKNKPIAFKSCSHSRRLLVPTNNYVFLKRFTSKEEHRRLVASCFFKDNIDYPYVALENHLNYVYQTDQEMTKETVCGIAALFNSILLDRYFRTISGNTQVNATEIRTMKFPELKIVSQIGRYIMELNAFTPHKTEHIVLNTLGVNGDMERYLMEFACE